MAKLPVGVSQLQFVVAVENAKDVEEISLALGMEPSVIASHMNYLRSKGIAVKKFGKKSKLTEEIVGSLNAILEKIRAGVELTTEEEALL